MKGYEKGWIATKLVGGHVSPGESVYLKALRASLGAKAAREAKGCFHAALGLFNFPTEKAGEGWGVSRGSSTPLRYAVRLVGMEREGNRKDERAEGRRERDKNRVSRQSARLGQRNTVTGPGRKVNLPFLRGLTTPPPPLADSSRSCKPRTIISNNAAKFITPTHR